MPLSPHLSVYRPQITSVTSIVGRICGVYLFFVLLFGIWISFPSSDLSGRFVSFLFELPNLYDIRSLICLLVWWTSFALTFYVCAVVRHLLWDFGKCLGLSVAKMLGYGMFVLSFVVSGVALGYTALCVVGF